MVDHVFILAGGSGTRLWPASNSAHPKQFIPVREGKSLLQLTLERALALQPSGRIFLITLKDQLEPVLEECDKLGDAKKRIAVLPEPAARNTAPAIAAAAEYVKSAYGPEQTVTVLPADHLITPTETFAKDTERADILAREGYLVTFGIPPTRPETGFGYIEAGEELSEGQRVRSFREKPDRSTAEQFVKAGNYYWNSGMFAFRAGTYLDELGTHSPEIGGPFSGIGEKGRERSEHGIRLIMEGSEIERIYKDAPKNSIDYAVMEKSSRAAMVPAVFTWSDIGSWEEMAELFESEGRAGGDTFEVEAQNNFVYSDMPVALCGVDDLMVVVKNGAVLVARRGSGQLVKKAVEEMKEQDRSDIL
jgi:mannose-1-phosphate guanylyltransferase/mannose-6-phosphate isomerase